MMKFFIFHGTFTKTTSNWYQEFAKTMRNLGHEVVVPQYPIDDFDAITAIGENQARKKTDRKQTLENWTDYFELEILPQCNGEMVWIGHSLGPVFMLHLLTKFDIKLQGAIFVSPFLERLPDTSWQFDVANGTFYSNAFDSELLKERVGFSYVLYSSNDPYVPTNHALKFAQLVDSTTLPVKDGHHLGGKYTKLPLVEELAKTFVGYEESTDISYLAK